MKSIKGLIVILSVLTLLVGCGVNIPVKDHEDRKNVTESELNAIKETVDQMKGVESSKFNHVEGGLYASIKVTDKKYAKDVAIVAFKSMVAETLGSVDVFVQEEDDMLIQASKKPGTDDENKWDFLY